MMLMLLWAWLQSALVVGNTIRLCCVLGEACTTYTYFAAGHVYTTVDLPTRCIYAAKGELRWRARVCVRAFMRPRGRPGQAIFGILTLIRKRGPLHEHR
jgi:hypothetical protein